MAASGGGGMLSCRSSLMINRSSQNTGSGVLIGEKGKQYGLILPAKPAAAAAPKLKNVFNVDDDDQPSSVNQTLISKAQQQKSAKLAAEEHKKALEQDPSIFDYDGVVDAIQEKRETKQMEKTAEQLRREPRYALQLFERAKIKKLEDELVYERQIAKERAVDDHLYGDKEKYMTGAYKQKLQELQKFKDDIARRAAEDEKNAVEKRGNMSGFYNHLLKDNENMGTGPRDFGGKEKPPAAAAKMEDGKISDRTSSEQSRSSRHGGGGGGGGGGGRRGGGGSSGSRRHREDDDQDDDHQRKREYTPGGTELPWKRFKNPLNEKKEKMLPKLLPRLDDQEIEAARARYLKRKHEREAAAAV